MDFHILHWTEKVKGGKKEEMQIFNKYSKMLEYSFNQRSFGNIIVKSVVLYLDHFC